ncbi:hypothetical protein T484DRAFT_1795019 [Baffinella frigidus]|nr:hypothetical protein T484DRAFT_1795019 [Cryptophyta sp. CCMP2293]
MPSLRGNIGAFWYYLSLSLAPATALVWVGCLGMHVANIPTFLRWQRLAGKEDALALAAIKAGKEDALALAAIKVEIEELTQECEDLAAARSGARNAALAPVQSKKSAAAVTRRTEAIINDAASVSVVQFITILRYLQHSNSLKPAKGPNTTEDSRLRRMLSSEEESESPVTGGGLMQPPLERRLLSRARSEFPASRDMSPAPTHTVPGVAAVSFPGWRRVNSSSSPPPEFGGGRGAAEEGVAYV